MTRKVVAMVAALAVLLPTLAEAAGQKETITGIALMATGVGLTLGAFNYDSSCPRGYTTHRFHGAETQCVSISSSGDTDVIPQPIRMSLERPLLLWGGLAAAGAGAALLFLPKRVQRAAPSVTVTPRGVAASKSVSW